MGTQWSALQLPYTIQSQTPTDVVAIARRSAEARRYHRVPDSRGLRGSIYHGDAVRTRQIVVGAIQARRSFGRQRPCLRCRFYGHQV